MTLRPFYIPWQNDVSYNVINRVAATWLNEQPGQGVVIGGTVANLVFAGFTRMCVKDTIMVGIKSGGRLRRWGGGAVVVSAPHLDILNKYRDVMIKANAVLITEWAPAPLVTEWLRTEKAVDFLTQQNMI